MRTLTFAIPLACITGAVQAQQLPGDVVRGEVLADRLCAQCHNVEAGGAGLSAEGAPAFQALVDNRKLNALSLRVLLRTPHRNMPDIILEDAPTDDVISYILDLR